MYYKKQQQFKKMKPSTRILHKHQRLASKLIQYQLSRANLCNLSPPRGPGPLNDVITAGHGCQSSLGGAHHSSDHGNYCISISVGLQRGYTHSCGPSFVPGPGAALPSFIPQPLFKEANEHGAGTSVFHKGGFYSDIQRPFCEIL